MWLNMQFHKTLTCLFVMFLLFPARTSAVPFPLPFPPPYFQFIGTCVGLCVDSGFSGGGLVFPPGTPMASDIFLNSASDFAPGTVLTLSEYNHFTLEAPFPGVPGAVIQIVGSLPGAMKFSAIVNSAGTGFVNNEVVLNGINTVFGPFELTTDQNGNWNASIENLFVGQGSGAFWELISPVPEASSLVLVLSSLGLMLVPLMRRRRQPTDRTDRTSLIMVLRRNKDRRAELSA
jgi:hypothetical protein